MELMEKQGGLLADRPRSIAAAETLSGGMAVLVEGAGDRLRKLRRCGYTMSSFVCIRHLITTCFCGRVLHAVLQPKVAVTYEPVQLRHAKNVLLDILEDPGNHQMHTKRCALSCPLLGAFD